MELKLDLHIHSAHSPDGRMELEEIAALCRERGLNGAAVCDHDRVLTDAPEYPDLLLIPGVEVSTQFGHLLGLFVTKQIETKDFYAAVEEIHAQGGLAVLAHPFQHHTDPARIEPVAHLLDGVEVFNSRADRKNKRANAMAARFAAEHALAPFAGSDAHVPQEVGRAFVTLDVPGPGPDGVKAALKQGRGVPSGSRSPARYTAMSQLTKRKKTGASLPAYGKWALFALKCVAQDIFCKGD